MCSVHGFYRFPWATLSPEVCAYRLAGMVAAGAERGSDSWGVRWSTGREHRSTGDPAVEVPVTDLLERAAVWAVANCRAEPTTEFVERKRTEDVQPYTDRGVTVVHNGTVANDADLRARYDLHPDTAVDSAVLPGVLASTGLDVHAVARVLTEEVVGSFALAAAAGDRMVLAVNYKPMTVLLVDGVLFFTSLERYAQPSTSLAARLAEPWCTLTPYSAVQLTPHGSTEVQLVYGDSPRRALVVCSGGLDSTVAAALTVEEGWDVTLLHFTYGCRAEQAEVRAVQDVAEALGCEVLFVDMTTLFRQVGGSPLTSTGAPVAAGEAGAEFAHEWVPARNLVLLSVATALAEGRGYSRLVLGNNVEEAGAYPDNEMAFVDRVNEVLPYAVNVGATVRVTMPVGHLTKRQIVQAGVRVGAPLDRTWSCYENGDRHCGACGPCFMRRTAYRMSNLVDPMLYLTDDTTEGDPPPCT